MIQVLALLVPLLAAAQEIASPWESYLAGAVSAATQKKFGTAEQLMALAEKEAGRFNQSDPRLGSTYNTSGLIFLADSKPKEAEQNFQKALSVFEKAYGEKSLDVANVAFNLSDALRQEGKYDASEPFLRRTLDIYLAILGKDSPKVAQTYFFWRFPAAHAQF